LTGERLRAFDCLHVGLATHYLPAEKVKVLLESVKGLNDEVGRVSVLTELLDELRGSNDPPNADASVIIPHENAIEKCFSASSLEGVFLALSTYADDKEWAERTLKTLKSMSPTSLKVTFEAVKRHMGKETTIKEALTNEYRMSQRFMRLQPDSDFAEGIRAVLVDKDKNPKWAYNSIEEIPKEAVEEFFSPLGSFHPRGEVKLEL